ncbi:hypothetical protein HMI56_006606 [Coelomomyces lativittatus]|nr:hypothetical protein HMI56_006606 [Coelomomyces lativittatus]
MRAEIEKFFTIQSDKFFLKLKLPLLTSKLSSFLDNPTTKHFDAFLQFSKESRQVYTSGNHKTPIQANDHMYDEMKKTFSNFFETTDEIFKASENLNLRTWSESDRNQNEKFEVKVDSESMQLIYKLSFNLILTEYEDPFS